MGYISGTLLETGWSVSLMGPTVYKRAERLPLSLPLGEKADFRALVERKCGTMDFSRNGVVEYWPVLIIEGLGSPQ